MRTVFCHLQKGVQSIRFYYLRWIWAKIVQTCLWAILWGMQTVRVGWNCANLFVSNTMRAANCESWVLDSMHPGWPEHGLSMLQSISVSELLYLYIEEKPWTYIFFHMRPITSTMILSPNLNSKLSWTLPDMQNLNVKQLDIYQPPISTICTGRPLSRFSIFVLE